MAEPETSDDEKYASPSDSDDEHSFYSNESEQTVLSPTWRRRLDVTTFIASKGNTISSEGTDSSGKGKTISDSSGKGNTTDLDRLLQDKTITSIYSIPMTVRNASAPAGFPPWRPSCTPWAVSNAGTPQGPLPRTPSPSPPPRSAPTTPPDAHHGHPLYDGKRAPQTPPF